MVTYFPSTEADFFATMPLSLYKYRVWTNPNHRRLLTDLEIFFPDPKKFNDPYDCGLPLRHDQDDSDPIKIKNKLEQLAPYKFQHIKNDPFALQEEVTKQLLYIMQDPEGYFHDNYGFKRNDLSSIYGVLSLTPHPANFLMWSHYADRHKGFVIGFDTEKLVKQNFGKFAKVHYSDEIPVISVLEMNHELMHKLVYTKACFWKYEDEYRFTTVLSRNAKAIVDPVAFKTVHLGFDMPQTEKFAILDIIKEKYPQVRVFEMTLGKEKFELIPMQIF